MTKPKKPTRVIIYTRVSSEQQADSGLGLADQLEKCRAYAKLYGLDVVAECQDAGFSASSLERPAIREALDMLTRGEADALLVAKLDRLTRSVRDLGELVEGYFISGEHALLSVADHIDTRSANGRLVLNIMATIGQWEREAISERTVAALAVKKSRGERVGGVPYGFRVVPGTAPAKLEADPGEQGVVLKARDLAEFGNSSIRIAKRFNEAGLRARNGKPFSPTQIERMLRA